MNIFDNSIDDFFPASISDKAVINGDTILGVFESEYENVMGEASGISDNLPIFHTADKYVKNVIVGDALKYKGRAYRINEIRRESFGFSNLILEGISNV